SRRPGGRPEEADRSAPGLRLHPRAQEVERGRRPALKPGQGSRERALPFGEQRSIMDRKELNTMTRIKTYAALGPVLLALALGSARAGEIVGKVKYAGNAPAPAKIPVTKDQAVCGKVEHVDESLVVGAGKGVKNAVVNITDPKDGKKMTAAGNPVIDQNGCRFIPRVQIVPAGQNLDIINDDGILHNIHTWPKTNTPFNRAQPKFLKKMNVKFDKP